jgi:NADH-quinone oxidoreductase subunit C
MNQALIDLGDYIAAALPGEAQKFRVAYDELMVWTASDSLVKLLTFLRDDQNCQFKQLMDVTAVDYPDREQRFEIVYNLLSLKHNHRLRVKLAADEESQVPSVVQVFSSATWFEREVWDMYGVLCATTRRASVSSTSP